MREPPVGPLAVSSTRQKRAECRGREYGREPSVDSEFVDEPFVEDPGGTARRFRRRPIEGAVSRVRVGKPRTLRNVSRRDVRTTGREADGP